MPKVSTRNLEAEMKRKKISRQDIAKLLGVTYRTILSRFQKSDWSFQECLQIKEAFFPRCTLEYLFTDGAR